MTKDNMRQRFLDAAEQKHMLGAYLVICPRPDVAKRLVNEFLLRLYCKKGGCGVCADCRKVLGGHVDIMRLCSPRVEEFRQAISFIGSKAYEAEYKTVIIENADDMTDAAANSMLKTLEQPPKNTVIILEARSVSGVLPTIASRCAAVYLLPESDAETTIQNELGINKARAAVLSDLSGGFLDEAKRIDKDAEFWALRQIILEHCHKLLYQKTMSISTYADFLEKNKENIIPVLCVMQSYFRDICFYSKTKNKEFITNKDKTEQIAKAAADFTSGAISNIIRVILETERKFLFAVNFRLAAEKMFFDILEEKSRWKKL